MTDDSAWERLQTARAVRRRGRSYVAIGLFQDSGSFTPFWDGDWDTRGLDWLPFLSLAVWVACVLYGAFVIVRSYRSLSSLSALGVVWTCNAADLRSCSLATDATGASCGGRTRSSSDR